MVVRNGARPAPDPVRHGISAETRKYERSVEERLSGLLTVIQLDNFTGEVRLKGGHPGGGQPSSGPADGALQLPVRGGGAGPRRAVRRPEWNSGYPLTDRRRSSPAPSPHYPVVHSIGRPVTLASLTRSDPRTSPPSAVSGGPEAPLRGSWRPTASYTGPMRRTE